MFLNRLVPADKHTDKQFKKEIYFLWRKPKKMKHAKKLFCAALALLMALSLAVMPAFATGDAGDQGNGNGDGSGTTTPTTTTPTEYTELPIGMTLSLGDNESAGYVDAIPLFKTTVSLTSASAKEATDTDPATKAGVTPSGGWSALEWNYGQEYEYKWTEKSEKTETGKDVTKWYDVNTDTKSFYFSDVDFSTAGPGHYSYTLTVSHTPISSQDASKASLSFLGDSGATDTYDVTVTVLRKSDGVGLYISQIIVKDKDGKKVYTSGENTAVPVNETLDFVMLTITNEVRGSAADYNDEFNYHIVIPELGASEKGIELPADSTIKGYKTDRDDNKTEIEVPVGDDGYYFKLKEDESVVLFVPDTMIFTVTQENKDYTEADNGIANPAPLDYNTTHAYSVYDGDYTDGTAIVNLDKNKECDAALKAADQGGDGNASATTELNHKGQIKNTNDNAVHFINTKDVATNTGITMDIIPYVMVVAAAAALALLTISKKRKTDW
jgi:hypothetical protein